MAAWNADDEVVARLWRDDRSRGWGGQWQSGKGWRNESGNGWRDESGEGWRDERGWEQEQHNRSRGCEGQLPAEALQSAVAEVRDLG